MRPILRCLLCHIRDDNFLKRGAMRGTKWHAEAASTYGRAARIAVGVECEGSVAHRFSLYRRVARSSEQNWPHWRVGDSGASGYPRQIRQLASCFSRAWKAICATLLMRTWSLLGCLPDSASASIWKAAWYSSRSDRPTMHSRSTLMIISSWCHSRRSLLTAEGWAEGSMSGYNWQPRDAPCTRHVQEWC